MAKFEVRLIVEADSVAAAATKFLIDEEAQYVEDILRVEVEPYE